MLIGILGVLKAGAAYVPMDPSYPDDRIKYILSDIDTQLVLTNKKYEAKLASLLDEIKGEASVEGINSKDRVISLDSDEYEAEALLQSKSNLESSLTGTTSSHLAYVIYTSGTTGKPKGL
jgi:non-ribosomal peptide synthetase component F